MLATGAHGIALEVGALSPTMSAEPEIATGEIGYIVTNLKTTRDAKVGDTITTKRAHADAQLTRLQTYQTFCVRRFLPNEQRRLQ